MKWRAGLGLLSIGVLLGGAGCGTTGRKTNDGGGGDATDARSAGDARDGRNESTADGAVEQPAVDAMGEDTPDAPSLADTGTATDVPADANATDAGATDAGTGTDAPTDANASDVPGDAATDSATATDGSSDTLADAPPAFDAGTGCTGSDGEALLSPAGVGLPANGLVLWVRADHGIYKNAQNGVCAWRDQSGKANDLRPPAGALPTWESGAVGGQPAVHSSSSQYLYVDGTLGIAATSGRTFIAVSQLVTTNGRFHPIIQGQSGSPGTYLAIDANTWITAGSREGVYVTNSSFDTALPTKTTPRLHVLTVSSLTPNVAIASAVSYRVDGAPQALAMKAGGGSVQSFGGANFTSIASPSSTPSGGVVVGSGYVAEAIVYDRPLTSEEIAAVEAILEARYGIVAPPADAGSGQ